MLNWFWTLVHWKALPVFDGTHSKAYWATRDTEQQSSASAYWEQRTHPLRTLIAETVAKLDGESLLEVGVHAGPTIWAICQKKQFSKLAGTDISKTVLDFTRRTLPESLGQSVDLIEAPAEKLPFADKSFDIVVTSGLLVCIGPEAIEKSLSEILRVAKYYLVLSEPHCRWRERLDRNPNTSYWIRNYERMLLGRARLLYRQKLSRQTASGHMNSILVFEILPQ